MKKTVTIDFTFKRWMKLALLAVAFMLMSYLFMTGAHAQSSTGTGTISMTSGTTTCGNCLYIPPSKPVVSDPSFSQVWFGAVSIIFLIGAFFTTLGAIVTWKTDETEE